MKGIMCHGGGGGEKQTKTQNHTPQTQPTDK